MRTKRQGLIVWFQHKKNIKHLKKFGNLIYISLKMRYAIIYVDQNDINRIEETLLKLPYITKVDHSYKPFLKTDYENARPDQAKVYDYKLGK